MLFYDLYSNRCNELSTGKVYYPRKLCTALEIIYYIVMSYLGVIHVYTSYRIEYVVHSVAFR